MFFDSWTGLIRVVVVGTLAYSALVLVLRASGKRTLSKLNAFDFLVTVALGSTLATVLLSKDVALLEGLVAFLLLIGLQYLITRLSSRYEGFQNLVKAEPALLVHNGKFLPAAMKRERVTREEVFAAMRAGGSTQLEDVAAVVLETDGSISVLWSKEDTEGEALQAVRRS